MEFYRAFFLAALKKRRRPDPVDELHMRPATVTLSPEGRHVATTDTFREVADHAITALMDQPAGDGLHALTVAVESLGLVEPGEPYRPVQAASVPALHRTRRQTADVIASMPLISSAPPPAGQLDLPIFDGLWKHGAPSWLLWLFDQGGGRSLAQGRGAPWPLRLFVAALVHLRIEGRDGFPHSLPFTAAQVAAWLHPDGWRNRRRDWQRFRQALDALGSIRVPFEVPHRDGGTQTSLVALVHATAIPHDWHNGTTAVGFTVRVPPIAGRGITIDWPRLTRYGAESAALYRGYLSIMAVLDRTARRGVPTPRKIGRPVGSTKGRIVRSATELVAHPLADRVPTLTDGDLAALFGFDPRDRFRRRDARRALERLVADGVCSVEWIPGGCFRLFGRERSLTDPRRP